MDKNNIQSPQNSVSVLSLFDGMSCGMIAMLNAGLDINSYTAYEIDKYAIKTSQHNFPNIIQCGDVFAADFTEYQGVDYLIGGSPCTYWSIAQTANRETEASGLGWELFSQYVRALREAQPRFFIYENNKSMSKQIRASIDSTFGFEAICINSALLSAQNRERLYWVGKRNDDGSYTKVDICQPEDKGILLKDILDSGETWRTKSVCLDAHYYKGGNFSNLDKQSGQRLMVAEPINTTKDGKAQALRATCYKDGIRNMIANNVDRRTCVAEPIKVGEIGNGGQGNRLYSTDGKAVSQTATSGGLGSNTGLYIYPTEYSDTEQFKDKIYRVQNGYINIKGKNCPIKLSDGLCIIRKLSVSECMRLQTVPEWYDFSCVSNTQAYKMLGNGWTCDVITHLIQATINS